MDYLFGPHLITLVLKNRDLLSAGSRKSSRDSKQRIPHTIVGLKMKRSTCQKIGKLSPTTKTKRNGIIPIT